MFNRFDETFYGCPVEESEQGPRYVFPLTHDLQIAALYMQLARHDQMVEAAYTDPMSKYAPMCDFQGDWDRKLRKIISNLIARAKQVHDHAALEFAKSI